MKLTSKIPGSYGVGIMVALLLIATTLLHTLVSDGLLTIFGESVTRGTLSVLTFPVNLYFSPNCRPLGSFAIGFLLINPLIWGLAAFIIHWKIKSPRFVANAPGTKNLNDW